MRFIRTVVCALVVAIVTLCMVGHGAAAATDEPWRQVRLQVQRVAAAGTTFAYAELGSGSPLLLLNGTGSPMAEWDPALLAALADDHRVIVFDYPGLGRSGPAPASWRFAAAADWISEFVNATHPDTSVDVLGWSMGGFIAQQLAIRHPMQVRRLVLAATNPGGPRAVLGPRWVQEEDSNADATVRAYVRTNYPRDRASQAAGWAFVHRLTVAVNSGAYPDEQVPSDTYAAMVRAEDPWLRSNANFAQLPSIEVPTLVITGDQDVVTPPSNSRRISRALPLSRLVLVPGAGHSFLFQDPAGVATVVSDFLD